MGNTVIAGKRWMSNLGMNFLKHVDFLLKNACISIRYLVHKDMLKTPTDEPFMKERCTGLGATKYTNI